jgi:hypothetical protein
MSVSATQSVRWRDGRYVEWKYRPRHSLFSQYGFSASKGHFDNKAAKHEPPTVDTRLIGCPVAG